MSPLDDPIWASLVAGHDRLAVRSGQAARYPGLVSPFAGLEAPTRKAVRDLADLVDPEGVVAILACDPPLDEREWVELGRIHLIQMVCDEPVAPPQVETEPLSNQDVPEMLALAEQTRPGPFFERTIEMGRYVGLRAHGRVVAMGGERLRPTGHTEVSAICTAEDHRGRGLAETIVRELVSSIQARGERAFLHVMAGSPTQVQAVRLYERLGFRERKRHALAILKRI